MWKPRGTAESKKPQCGANEEERHSKAIRDEAIRVEAERIARSYGVRLADDDSTFAAKVRMVIRSKAEDVVDEREEERAKRSDPCHPHGGLARPKKGLPNVD